jgi:hypothetical protein
VRRAIELHPTALKYFKLSSFCLYQRKIGEAREAVEQVLRLQPDMPEAIERLEKIDALGAQ